ncbi:GH39 family glycosyl hydrolase [Miltoncostaea marina]|uniref:GH39 family glycosyl hydrolase n=1 Tax=Miltoncostaea marina TaxID=2843215 RepID=UPI001C3CDB66|nr:cellulase family glycosylhydrolase [Miltoncostaea marina]
MSSLAPTPRRTILGLAIAGAASAALVVPATGVAGVAAVQDDVLAVAPLAQIPERVEMVKQTRAKVTRVDILWHLVAPTAPATPRDPADPAYDWSRLDAIFTGLAAVNVTPIVSTYSTPEWAVLGKRTKHGTEYNPNAPRPAAYGDFLRAVATRYSGSYVPAGAVAPLPRIRHFEVWNEPNLKAFFSHNGKANVTTYKKLVRTAYTNIKAVNKRSIVIAGVGGPRSSTGGGNVGAKVWMNKLVNDKRLKFDAYSQHIYPSQGPKFRSRSYDRAFPTWNSLDEIYKTLDKKRKGMKLYVTEAGYTTAKTPFRTTKVVSFARQRQFLNQLFNLKQVKSPRLAAVVWFNLQDNEHWPAGLIRADGRKKPSYAAFQKFARRPIPAALRAELRR